MQKILSASFALFLFASPAIIQELHKFWDDVECMTVPSHAWNHVANEEKICMNNPLCFFVVLFKINYFFFFNNLPNRNILNALF